MTTSGCHYKKILYIISISLTVGAVAALPIELAVLNNTDITTTTEKLSEPIYKVVKLHASSRKLHKPIKTPRLDYEMQLPFEKRTKNFYKPKLDAVSGSLSVFPAYKDINKVLFVKSGKENNFYLVVSVPEEKQEKVYVFKIPQPKTPSSDKVIFDRLTKSEEEIIFK